MRVVNRLTEVPLLGELPVTELELVAVILLAAAGATVQGSVGIGFALVAGPALVAIEPGFVPGPLLIIGQLVGLRHILAERADADLSAWWHCLWGLPVGMAAGLWMLELVDDRALALLVGGLTVVAAVMLLAGVSWRRTTPVEVVAGATCTFAAVTAGLPGPPLIAAFSDMAPRTLRSTSSMFIGVIAGFSAVGLWLTGNFGRPELTLLALLVPGTLLGLLIARFVRPHLERPWFRPLVLVVALLGGLALLIRNL